MMYASAREIRTAEYDGMLKKIKGVIKRKESPPTNKKSAIGEIKQVDFIIPDCGYVVI